MDLKTLDGLLQRYSAAENRVGANLQELDSHTTYQVLRTDALQGQTQAKLGIALRKSEKLWQYYVHLQSIMNRARVARGSSATKAEDAKALTAILTERSVVLSNISIPLEERDLLDAAESEERVTIDELLSRMRQVYEPIRDGVAEVERVHRDILPRLDAASITLQRAKKEAEKLRITEPDLSAALRELDRVRRLSLDDPLALGVKAGAELDRLVRLAAGRVADAKQGHDRLDGDVGAMAGLLAEIRTLRARAEAVRRETLRKIASPSSLVRVPGPNAIDGPGGLAEARDVIEDSPMPDWQQQRHRVDDWLRRARKLRDQLRRAEERNGALLVKRDELRGLLQAYRAKMAAVGRSEDVELREIADELHNELYTAPSNLDRAEMMLRGLGEALAPQGGRR